MLQQAIDNQLLLPSLDYYCCSCKKILMNCIRVVAHLRDQNRNVNVCPGCVTLVVDKHGISYYFICDKLNRPISDIQGVTGSELLSTMKLLDKEGIEQMDYIDGNNQRNKEIYQMLNERVFRQQGSTYKDLKSKFIPQSEVKLEAIKPDKEALNRKHLKAMGYSWERKEFAYQPESIFGLLLGSLQKTEENEKEFDELSQVLAKNYTKQQKVFEEVKDYMVNTLFLLGRKGFNQTQGAPACITELRKCQDEIKAIMAEVMTIVNSAEKEETPKPAPVPPTKQKKVRKKRQKKVSSSEDQKETSKERSRDLVKREKSQQSTSQRMKDQKEKDKRKKGRMIEYAEDEPSGIKMQDEIKRPGRKLGSKNIKRQASPPSLFEPKSKSHKQVKKEPEPPPVQLKRGRGRPRGSSNKAKLQSSERNSESNDKPKVVLKSNKCEKIPTNNPLFDSKDAVDSQQPTKKEEAAPLQIVFDSEKKPRRFKEKDDSEEDKSEIRKIRGQGKGRGRGRGRGRPRKSALNEKESSGNMDAYDSADDD